MVDATELTVLKSASLTKVALIKDNIIFFSKNFYTQLKHKKDNHIF